MADFDPTDFGGGGGTAYGTGGDPLLEDADEGGDPQTGAPGADAAHLRDAVLFVVDLSWKEALTPLRPGGRSVLGEAFAAAASVLKTKVITSPDDKLGIVLYGVREKQNPNGFEGIQVLQELDRPSAPRIKQLEQEAARTPAQFVERYGCAQPVALSDVFWTCTTLFNLSANPKQFQPRVFLFTGNDSPALSATELFAAKTRAQDLLDMGVEVEFFPLVPDAKGFSIERFWADVLPVDPEDFVGRAAMRLEELERRIRMRVHRKRTLQRLKFQLAPGVEMAISVFVTILETKIPAPIYLLNENNKPLKSETKHICAQTGALLHPVDDIETFVELSGERIPVSRAEMVEIKHGCEPCLKLLGFKPQSCLKPHHRIFHSYFVYPDEKAISGSGSLCAALLKCMLEKRLMALASYVARKNAEPAMVVLLPQAELQDPSGAEQIRPPGFHMIRLPWAEEIRELSFPAPQSATLPSVELVEAARRAITALKLGHFVPGCAENPVLQKHWAKVQALALGEDQPEETVDVLQPDEAALAAKAPLLEAWKSAIDAAAGPRGAAMKRPFAAVGDGAACGFGGPPKVRREAVPAPTTREAMREMVLSGEVDRLTVPVLKDWLKGQGISCSGKKSDLVERVKNVV